MNHLFIVSIILFSLFSIVSSTPIGVTLRNQVLQTTGRIRWSPQERVEEWEPSQTAMVVVDMWDKHWCPSATERVGAIAVFINETINAGRDLGIQIIHAPSETSTFYNNTQSRKWVLSLPNVTMPTPIPHDYPPMPLNTDDLGCDVPGFNEYKAWTRETPLITIHDEDGLIDDEQNGQTLYNIVAAKGIKNIMYMGVHENMCIMNRAFAIVKSVSWGLNVAVIREATDTMYEPMKPPYVDHETSVIMMTEYIEKFWANSISAYDFLNPRNASTVMKIATQNSSSMKNRLVKTF